MLYKIGENRGFFVVVVKFFVVGEEKKDYWRMIHSDPM